MIENVRTRKERKFWDKVASRYDRQSAIYQKTYQMSIEKIKNILQKDHKVLEVACGTGIISLGIADQVNNIIAIDISPQMISVAQNKATRLSVSNVDFQVADGYSLIYEDESFDVIILFNALHIVQEPETVLSEMYRLLKPDGYLVTATDCYAEPVIFSVKLQLLAAKIMKLLGMISYLKKYQKADIINLLTRNNFEFIEDAVLFPAPVNYFVLGRKR